MKVATVGEWDGRSLSRINTGYFRILPYSLFVQFLLEFSIEQGLFFTMTERGWIWGRSFCGEKWQEEFCFDWIV